MCDQPTKTSLRWVVCGLLFLVTTINYIDRSALGLVEPVLKHMLGGDGDTALYNRHYSNIVTCFIVAYGLGFLVSGRVIDRVGAKAGLALSIVVWGAASISHAFARTAVGFGLARFALGLGESGNFPAALKATADWFPVEERALATGIFNSGTSAASLIAPLIIPWAVVRFGWKAAFFVTALLSAMWLVAWLAVRTNGARGLIERGPRHWRREPRSDRCYSAGERGRSHCRRRVRIRCGGFTCSGCRSFSMSDFRWTCSGLGRH